MFKAILTAAMEMLGGKDVSSQCRKPEIMADAAYAILTKDATFTGHFAIDDEILEKEGITEMDQYAVEPGTPDEKLVDIVNIGEDWLRLVRAFPKY